MSNKLSTKAGIFESGEKDVFGVQYKDGRLIACRNSKLEDYTVAEGTEVVCDRAFMNLKELRSVKLPDSLRAIGESAFSGCKALADINIPEGVTEIRQATFRDCDTLAAIELPASVTEIEKFAFGRGLTTLVVNAPETAIDKYAFMNARDFTTLIVPAGRTEYYRALLADIRVKATVEEMPAESSLIEESTINKHNMEEEKKPKIVTVEVFGYEKWLEPKDSDEEEGYDVYSRFAEDGMIFTVGDKEYTPSDFADADDILAPEQQKEYKEIDASEIFSESGAEEGWLYVNKAWTTIDIEMPEDEEFDPSKAALVLRDFIYPDETDEPTVCAFLYDGKVYDCLPEDSRGISGDKIWPVDEENDEEEEELEADNPENKENREIEYIKTLEIYAQETDPDDEESYYEYDFIIGEKYSDVQIQSAIDEIDDDDTGDDFWHQLIVNLGEIDWDGLFEYLKYVKITDSNENQIFEEDCDFR